ncbi:MAG: Type III pantothenate kinase [Fimbriimonadaceae bacterium]|nr:Type III pantothenate kinase [Fimbriimonadaceae bacterium]
MLWAIDVGNTQTAIGLHDGRNWVTTIRLSTISDETEDELAAKLSSLLRLAGLDLRCDKLVIASVVPDQDRNWQRLAAKWLKVEARFLRSGGDVGIRVTYDPPHAVGADRLANAVASLAEFSPPIVVVDFGTATTFDVIDGEGTYVGGAILSGPVLAIESLATRTAKLPRVDLAKPDRAIGATTVQAIRSGVMYGYAGGIDRICDRIQADLGQGARLVATGGLAQEIIDMCDHTFDVRPMLTLEGLRLFADRV